MKRAERFGISEFVYGKPEEDATFFAHRAAKLRAAYAPPPC